MKNLDQSLTHVHRLARLLSNHRRLGALVALAVGPLDVTGVSKAIGARLPATSRVLTQLCTAGLVRREIVKNRRVYILTAAARLDVRRMSQWGDGIEGSRGGVGDQEGEGGEGREGVGDRGRGGSSGAACQAIELSLRPLATGGAGVGVAGARGTKGDGKTDAPPERNRPLVMQTGWITIGLAMPRTVESESPAARKPAAKAPEPPPPTVRVIVPKGFRPRPQPRKA